MIDTFGTKIMVLNRVTHYEISISTIRMKDGKGVSWDDIKDDFIPFFQLLCTNYELYPFTIGDSSRKCIKIAGQHFTKYFVLNDKVGKNPASSITINIKKQS